MFGTLEIIRINSIYDGDSFNADIKDVHPIIGNNIGIRIAGIDTPELTSPNPNEQKAAIQARTVLFNIFSKSKTYCIKNAKRDKYFRIVGDVFADNVSVAALLIGSGFARPYYGGEKLPW